MCGKHDFTPIRKFNLMFKTQIGVTEDSSSTCYLRPETAQGIFVNFANIQRTTRRKLAVRRVPGGQGVPQRDHARQLHLPHPRVRADGVRVLLQAGHRPGMVRLLEGDLQELAAEPGGSKKKTCACATTRPPSWRSIPARRPDIEYAFPFTDWGELWGIADRTDYDLGRHQEASGKSLEYFDPETNEHYIPYVIEPSLGCDRVALAFLCEAYDEEHLTDAKGKEDVRTVLRLHPFLAPFKCAVLPLSKKLSDKAMEIRNELAKDFMVDFDDAGSIGKRYRRQDEIGTPLCVTGRL